jgi:hypothetical protein
VSKSIEIKRTPNDLLKPCACRFPGLYQTSPSTRFVRWYLTIKKNYEKNIQLPTASIGFLLCFAFLCMKQQRHKKLAAKIFLGVAGSLHWSSSCVSASLMAERILHSKRNLELSIQGTHTFRHT